MNQNKENLISLLIILIFAFLCSDFIYTMKNHDFTQSVNVISASATFMLAIVACYGLFQWKKQMRGTDKYKALIDIKVKFLDLQKIYQSLRLSFIIPIDLKNSKNVELLKLLANDSNKQLWGIYNKILNSISFYEIVHPETSLSLKDEVSESHFLIREYLTSITILNENILSPNKSDRETLDYCEKYIRKNSDEIDIVTQSIYKLKNSVFHKIDEVLKQI